MQKKLTLQHSVNGKDNANCLHKTLKQTS